MVPGPLCRFRARLHLAPLVLVLLAAAPGRAQVEAPSRLSITWENDTFARTDRHYTNGLRLELAGGLDPSVFPSWLRCDEAEWGLAVGQQIYTPERLDAPELVPDDRPYAGWAYLGLSLARRVAAFGWEDRIELKLGVVGPSSGARALHELAHRLHGSQPPRGWGHQLRDELAVALEYRAGLELARAELGSLSFDLRPRASVSLGNVATYASLGLAARFGLGIPSSHAVDTRGSRSPLRLYVTASADLRLAGYDIFLDGSLLRTSGHRVAKQWLVADASVGITLAVHDRLALSFVHTLRSPEFVGQAQIDQFGSVSLTVAW